MIVQSIDPSILGKYSLFNGLEKEQMDFLLPLLEQEVFEGTTEIVADGDRSDKLRLILVGRVAVFKGGRLLMELAEGDVFGEMEILDVGPSDTTVKALTSTKVISLSIDAFGSIYEKDIEIYSFLFMNLARDLARRQRRVDAKTSSRSPPMDWS